MPIVVAGRPGRRPAPAAPRSPPPRQGDQGDGRLAGRPAEDPAHGRRSARTPARLESSRYGRSRATAAAATQRVEPVWSNSATETATVPSDCPVPESAGTGGTSGDGGCAGRRSEGAGLGRLGHAGPCLTPPRRRHAARPRRARRHDRDRGRAPAGGAARRARGRAAHGSRRAPARRTLVDVHDARLVAIEAGHEATGELADRKATGGDGAPLRAAAHAWRPRRASRRGRGRTTARSRRARRPPAPRRGRHRSRHGPTPSGGDRRGPRTRRGAHPDPRGRGPDRLPRPHEPPRR